MRIWYIIKFLSILVDNNYELFAEIPNVLNSNQFKLLKEWNGELRFLPKFKLKRFSKKYLERLALSNDVKPIESDTKTEMEIV